MKRKLVDRLKAGGSKLVGSAMSVALAVGLMPLPAFAANLEASSVEGISPSSVTPQAVTAKSPNGQLICAAFAANIFTPEMLGMSNPNYRDNSGTGETDRDSSEPGILATIFGDEDINESVDPFLYNYKNSTSDNHLTNYIAWGGREKDAVSGNPMLRLLPYVAEPTSTSYQNAVWEYMPQIVLGTNTDARTKSSDPANLYKSTTEYWTDAQKTAFKTKTNKTDAQINTYINSITGVHYDATSLATLTDTVYNLADAATDALKADNSIKTRYTEEPASIAKNYERYTKGMKGYVLKAIDEGIVNKRTVAVVGSYSSSSKTFNIDTIAMQTGTTSNNNRFLEGVLGVANNLYATLGKSTVTASELNQADLIIVNGKADTTVLNGLESNGLLSKTFYMNDASRGALFMLTANSCESGCLVGRILPCLYPELLDQSDMIAYWYDEFFHVKSGALGSTIESKMTGSRNWAAANSGSYLTWSASDVSDYSKSNVENILKLGSAYLVSKNDTFTTTDDTKYLKLATDSSGNVRLAGDTGTALAAQTVTPSTSSVSIPCGTTATISATSSLSSSKISYSSANTKVATVDSSGKITATGAGTTTVYVLAAGNSTTAAGSAKVAVTVTQGTASLTLKGAQSMTYTGKQLAYTNGYSAKTGDGAVSYSYYSDAGCTKAATPINVGTYYVRGTTKATTNYKAATSAAVKFTITQAANAATAKKTSVSSTLKVKNLKKKAATIKLPAVTTTWGTASWKVSTKDKKKVLSLKSGKIQVKKKAKKGTYTIKLVANVKATTNYAAAKTKTVTVKVKVK